tara:strand:- start:804 stop:1064 length:261 start_codon:yes stop_codon:yes gene_type:complete
MNFYLRIGDLLHNPENGALGLITKVTKSYFYFHLMSCEVNGEKYLISEDRASKRKVYESVDNDVISVHLGTKRNRRKRKRFYHKED